jgi:hypothetical protein
MAQALNREQYNAYMQARKLLESLGYVLINRELYYEMQEQMSVIIDHISDKTKIVPVPYGDDAGLIPRKGNELPSSNNFVRVPMFRLFNRVVGYNVDEDIIVYWKEKYYDGIRSE